MVKLATEREREDFVNKLEAKVNEALREASEKLAGEGEHKKQYEALQHVDEAFVQALIAKKNVENKVEVHANSNSSENTKKLLRNIGSALDECANKLLPEVLFKMRSMHAILTFTESKGEEADVEAFRKAFRSHVDEFSTAVRAQGKSEISDYIKAAGLALLGALVAIITSPMLLVSAGHGHWLKTNFFSGPETDKSKEFQKKLDDEVFTSCLPTA